MVTQLQPDVRAYLHGGEVIKRYIRIEEVAHEYGFSVEETEYIAKAASSLYKLTRIHLVKKERFDEFMKHIYKVPGTNKQIIKKFARIGEASIIYSIGRHRDILRIQSTCQYADAKSTHFWLPSLREGLSK